MKWGSGLDSCMTAECLPDYWPGENKMGKMLKEIRSVLLEARCLQELNLDNEHEENRKNPSPLQDSAAKRVLKDD